MNHVILKNQKGQVAIFVALVFQVLFVFFAMVINIGLLVHHKINLQNSVDLAAYYAASKQAENLNAIAHINYQIRQSWKLLAFRYRGLGSIGLETHPSGPGMPPDPSTGAIYKQPSYPFDVESDDIVNSVTGSPNFEYGPIFCLSFRPTFINSPPDQNVCKNSMPMDITRIQIPPNIASFAAINAQIQNNARQLQMTADNAARFVGPGNFFLLMSFIVGHRADNKNRRDLIRLIANGMSDPNSPGNFYDLEGGEVLIGAKKTFMKNLSSANRDAATIDPNSFKIYSSLSHPNCGSTGDSKKPPKWLSEIYVDTQYAYTDFALDTSDSYRADYKFLPNAPGSPDGPIPRDITGFEQYVTPFIDLVNGISPNEDWFDSIGVEKNPWCMAYVGVEASVSPKLPFMPPGMNLTLKARSFAKPFGGRIGPWYTKTWSAGSNRSNGAENNPIEKFDPMMAPRLDINNTVANKQDMFRFPNYARYPGDSSGLSARLVQRWLGRKLFATQNMDWKMWTFPGIDFNVVANNPTGDYLAFNTDPNTKWRQMRLYETTAVAPDIFDITYYSIEPNFAQVYLPKLKKLVGNTNRIVRGDLGWQNPEQGGLPEFKDYSIKDQINDILRTDFGAQTPFMNCVPDNLGSGPNSCNFNMEKIYHTVIKKPDEAIGWGKVLTSWTENSLLDYSFTAAQQTFAKCPHEPEDGKPETGGNCLGGGRTGFSVKLVNEDFIKSNIPSLGGQGQDGPIINPPPENF